MYKLIAIDIDGTLLNNEKTITKSNFEMIKKAMSRGVKILITSGRSIKSSYRVIEPLGLHKENFYASAFTGATIYRTDTREILQNYKLDRNVTKEIVNKLDYKEIGTVIYKGENELYTPCKNKYVDIYSEMLNQEIIEMEYDYKDDVQDVFLMYKKAGIPSLIEQFKYLEKEGKAKLMGGASQTLEFVNPKCNKGNSLKTIADLYNIPLHEVAAIGDSHNDMELIETAGYGIAMKNGINELKNIADYTTDKTNDESGVAEAIERVLNL